MKKNNSTIPGITWHNTESKPVAFFAAQEYRKEGQLLIFLRQFDFTICNHLFFLARGFRFSQGTLVWHKPQLLTLKPNCSFST